MNSPIGWIGGKRALRKEIIALFPQDGVAATSRYFLVLDGCFSAERNSPDSSK